MIFWYPWESFDVFLKPYVSCYTSTWGGGSIWDVVINVKTFKKIFSGEGEILSEIEKFCKYPFLSWPYWRSRWVFSNTILEGFNKSSGFHSGSIRGFLYRSQDFCHHRSRCQPDWDHSKLLLYFQREVVRGCLHSCLYTVVSLEILVRGLAWYYTSRIFILRQKFSVLTYYLIVLTFFPKP